MRCEELKRRFSDNDAPETQEFTPDESEHLQNCAICSRLVALDAKLDAVIREELQQVEVPRRVQEKLRRNMRGEAASPQASIIKWAAVPALAMAAMLVLFLLPHDSNFASMDDIGQLAIQDHESHSGSACNKGIPADLATWGKETLGFAITAPSLPFTGSELIGVSKCTLGDCDTAHLTYVRNGKRFSVFIFPEKEAGFSLHRSRNYTLEFDTHQVTIWKTGQQVFALVT